MTRYNSTQHEKLDPFGVWPGPALVFVLFIAYYLMLWPFQPSLEVEDPVISEWLQQDGVVIYRRGEELVNSRIYINKGERIEGGCSVGCQRFWTVLGPRDWGEEAPGLRVSLTS